MTWTEIEARTFDLKAVDPSEKAEQGTRPSADLLDMVDAKGRGVAEALEVLRRLTDN